MTIASHMFYVISVICDHVRSVLSDFGHDDHIISVFRWFWSLWPCLIIFFNFVISVIVTAFCPSSVLGVFGHGNCVWSFLWFGDFGHYDRVTSFPLDSSLLTPCPHNFIFYHISYSRCVVSPFIRICSCAP